MYAGDMEKICVVRLMRLAACLGVFVFLVSARTSFAAGRDECSGGEGHVVKNLQGVQVEFTPTTDDAFVFGQACSVVVRDSAKNTIFSETDSGFSVVMMDSDVNGDGVPDLVLESYSGGAHCCWTYYIISLGANPRLLTQFENERGAAFVRNVKNGRIDIETQDGDFDYFDGQRHACTVFPLVYLRLEGTKFVDVGSEHLAAYDEIIAKSQKALSDDKRQHLRSLKSRLTEDQGLDDDTVSNSLKIVLAYLYSGREAEAHQTLVELWPRFDQERIWNLILESRRNGILSYTRDKNAA